MSSSLAVHTLQKGLLLQQMPYSLSAQWPLLYSNSHRPNGPQWQPLHEAALRIKWGHGGEIVLKSIMCIMQMWAFSLKNHTWKNFLVKLKSIILSNTFKKQNSSSPRTYNTVLFPVVQAEIGAHPWYNSLLHILSSIQTPVTSHHLHHWLPTPSHLSLVEIMFSSLASLLPQGQV